MCGRISYESVTIIFVKVFTFLCMFWLHSKRRLFWSINLIIMWACPRGQIFGQKLCAYGSCSALNITCQQICSFLTSIWAFAPFHSSKCPNTWPHHTSNDHVQNLSMHSAFFLKTSYLCKSGTQNDCLKHTYDDQVYGPEQRTFWMQSKHK